MKKITVFLTLLLVLTFTFSCNEKKETPKDVEIIKSTTNTEVKQENILNWKDAWTEGIGSIPGYKSFGKEEESRRVIGTDPDSNESILWECIPDNSTSWDGGFQTSNIKIDSDSPYMFVCWVKKTNSNKGKAYYAFNNVEHTTGESVTNAFFIGAGSTFPNLGDWYTLVGYIYPSNHVDDIEGKVISGLYFEGEKIQEGIDYKWSKGNNDTKIRVHLNNCKDSLEERLFIWNPQLYKVDGTEPKLYDLL